MFIVIEGLDGSGSSTQCELVAKFLRIQGKQVFVTKEPTNNVIGGLIRGSLTGVVPFPADCLQLLFSADRSHHLQREIIPILENKNVLICDRYLWSTIAFGSLELDKNWLLSLNKYFLLPDLTIFLKVSPESCIDRAKKNRFNLELFEEKEKMKKVWLTYEWLIKKYPKIVRVVNGEQQPEEVARDILMEIQKNRKFRGMLTSSNAVV